MNEQTITIKHVAKAAGVSTATVSRVLSTPSKVTDKTKIRVLEVIKKLNYVPNSIATSLVTKNSLKSIGVVILEDIKFAFLNPYFSEVIRGITSYLQCENFYMNILSYLDSDIAFKEIYSLYFAKKISGCIVLEIKQDDLLIKNLIAYNIPFILNGRFETDIPNTYSINTDSVYSSSIAVQYLIDKGHKDILFINSNPIFLVNQDRELGYRNTIRKNNISTEHVLYTDNSYENNKSSITQYFIQNPNISAIFAKDDLKAHYIIRILYEIGKRVPEDVSVIGHNDYLFSSLSLPSLTTCRVPIYDMGYLLAQNLIRLLNNDPLIQSHVIMNTELIERGSVK